MVYNPSHMGGPREVETDMPAAMSETPALTHLQRLEAESIHIMREVVAEADKPVMLYSVGKDSAVMLHLARKAFYPSPPPFPLLHVDTTWKFKAMYELRDRMARDERHGAARLPEPRGDGARHQPVRPRPAAHRHVEDRRAEAGARPSTASTRLSAARGATRRRAAPRSASSRFRTASHGWDPKNQRPELWNLYNARKAKGESIRVFPISQLDRARHLAIHPARTTSRSCRSISPPSARRWSATACC